LKPSDDSIASPDGANFRIDEVLSPASSAISGCRRRNRLRDLLLFRFNEILGFAPEDGPATLGSDRRRSCRYCELTQVNMTGAGRIWPASAKEMTSVLLAPPRAPKATQGE
jgi:hypothetical protein